MKIEITNGVSTPVTKFFSTPETDAEVTTFTSISKLKRRFEASTGKVSADFARRLERERDEARERLAKITIAAEAVIDRWEQPAWKDTEPTAVVIYRLRDALGREAE